MKNWKDVVVTPEMPLGDVIAKIDASALQVALVMNTDATLVGIVTDGDIRRALLRGRGLQIPVSETMNRNPTAVPASMPRDEMLAFMRRSMLHHLPLASDSGQVIGLVTLDELVGVTERPNWVVLMAGGLGTRLQPLTDECPKPLLEIRGKPILETIIESFAEQGFKRIFLAVNHKAEMICNHFGAGDHWGVRLDYLRESTRLGTAGALSLLPEKPTAPIIVMNGDLLTRTNFDNLLQFHIAQGATATMAVREYDFQVPYGVVRINGARIEAIEEKPVQKFFVNAGIYALSPEALDHFPSETFFDMPPLFERFIAAGKIIAAYPLREYWLDIGRLEEFERAQREWVRDQK
ncbi:MAG TPA: CBS domain-containing protein [Nitrospirales bacterium]|nr:CBS domain-containing protein [Nitrospirales bacterium]HIC05026.1 CBS domain-containing protein [Nitrospirales bacterium]